MNARPSAASSRPFPFGRGGVCALAVLLLIACIIPVRALEFPQLTGRVVDQAGILDPATKATLEQKLADFEAKTSGQIVVVTLKSLQGTSIDDYGYQLGRYWGIGQKGKNSGALLIIAPNEHQVRIEVGYGFEGTLTDAVSKLIIENAILPRFRAGDFAGGITRGVDDMIQAVSVDPQEWQERAKQQRPDNQSPAVNYLVFVLIWIVLMIIMQRIARQGRQQYRQGYPGRTMGGAGPIFVPLPGPSWGRSSWPGGFGGGGFGGGGFSGGGGSFGGGGASGSW